MKKSMAVMVVTAVAVTGIALAFGGERMRANVPFDFYVGTDLLPAGEYQFEMRSLANGSATASNVIVTNSDGALLAMRMATPGTAVPEAAHLHFTRYGSTSFLTTVEGMGLQAQLPKSSTERKLIARGAQAKEETLVASR